MKKLTLFFATILCYSLASAQNIPNPYSSIGKPTPKMVTLSNGAYDEFLLKEPIVLINGDAIDRKTGELVYSQEENPTEIEQLKKQQEDKFRFLSVDPLTRNFPFLTPYQYASNTPIQAIDLDGLESFKINNNSVEYFDQETGELKTFQTKQLVLTDAKAKFKVIDEDGVELNNFKYCSFACQMQNFKVVQQIPGGDNTSKLYTPNLKQGDKLNTENTFLVTIDKNFDKKVNFNSSQIYGIVNADVNKSNLEEKIADITQKYTMINMYQRDLKTDPTSSDMQNFSTIRISNGTNASQSDIINNLKKNGYYNDKMNIEYSVPAGGSSDTGKLNIEYGNYECKGDGCE
jgi:hypothetical protein